MRRLTREASSFRLAPVTKRLVTLLAENDGSQAEIVDRAVWELARARGVVVDWDQKEVEAAQATGREWVIRLPFPTGRHPGAMGAIDLMAPVREVVEVNWFGAVTGWHSNVAPPYLAMRFVVAPGVRFAPDEAAPILQAAWGELINAVDPPVVLEKAEDSAAFPFDAVRR